MPIDYAALAKESGATSSQPNGAIDYEALAKEAGATSSQPAAPRSFGQALLHAPQELLAGVGAGAISTGVGAYDLTRKIIPGADQVLPAPTPFVRSLTQAPNSAAGSVGKFGEQAAEFLVPSMGAAKLTKGAGVIARTLAQAGVGAGVSAVQSGGDPTSTAIGGAVGGAGELASAATSGVKSLLKAKAPTLANFAESFGGATPTQKARIANALGTLQKDGIVPGESVHETQDAVKGKLADLATSYQNLDPAIKARPLDPAAVVTELRKAQDPYMRRGVVTNAAAHAEIEGQIKTVEDIAKANGGTLNVDDLVHLKQNANGRTNFQSPEVETSLWNRIGGAYRSAADALAPETTPLNRDYQKYKDLEQIIDQNIARGKGTTPSGLDQLLNRGVQHATGATAGATLGAGLGPFGAAAGGIVGGIVGPKLGKAAVQAVQNAVDSGAFLKFSPIKQSMLKAAAGMGDTTTVLRLLGQSASEETALKLVPQTQ